MKSRLFVKCKAVRPLFRLTASSHQSIMPCRVWLQDMEENLVFVLVGSPGILEKPLDGLASKLQSFCDTWKYNLEWIYDWDRPPDVVQVRRPIYAESLFNFPYCVEVLRPPVPYYWCTREALHLEMQGKSKFPAQYIWSGAFIFDPCGPIRVPAPSREYLFGLLACFVSERVRVWVRSL